jgi:hypothetical protein
MNWLIWLLSLTAAANPESLDQQALRLFKAKKYKEACPLFRQIAEQRKTGTAWADLGLCELRRGDEKEGRLATLRAFRAGNDLDRQHAAFNWDSFHIEPALALRTDDLHQHDGEIRGCRWLTKPDEEKALGCDQGIWACVEVQEISPAGREPACGEQSSAVAALGTSPATLKNAEAAFRAQKLFSYPREGPGCGELVSLPDPKQRLPGVLYLQLLDTDSVFVFEGKSSGKDEDSGTDVLMLDPCQSKVALRKWRIIDDSSSTELSTVSLPDEPVAHTDGGSLDGGR